MAVQSPTDRLLTEANAAATYRTAAQVDTAADARITLKRGAANGVAGLGADGIVPSAQLPAASVSLTAYRTAVSAAFAATSGAESADDALLLSSVPVGRYRLRMVLFSQSSTSTAAGFSGRLAGTAVLGGNSRLARASTGVGTPAGTSQPLTTTSAFAYAAGTYQTTVAGTDLIDGFLDVTTAGSVQLVGKSSAATGVYLLPGCHLSLTGLA